MSRAIHWLWTNSILICDGNGLLLIARRIRFVVQALSMYDLVKAFIEAPPQSPIGRLMEARPDTIGVVIWPYQCLGWNARTRLARILEHYSVIARIGGVIDFPVNAELNLLDLREIRDGLRVVLDQPKWFMREGQLTINLFLGETRLYSLSFSLYDSKLGTTALIGSIQGRDIKNVLNEYRAMTKASHGMRPRDLLIEVLRMLCATLGVNQIFAIADEYRHHRDRYFGKAAEAKFSVNYNEIWEDRGGVRVEPRFYRLDVGGPQRELADVPAKKRAMYRRRSEMLRRLRQQMSDNYQALYGARKSLCSAP